MSIKTHFNLKFLPFPAMISLLAYSAMSRITIANIRTLLRIEQLINFKVLKDMNIKFVS